ncbi:hypothetical protein [Microbacterium sp.]|uniref:hypothetical protein n=1 Tax=Microbacterium sp. TaxID=51671 RepID=UPI0039E23FC0
MSRSGSAHLMVLWAAFLLVHAYVALAGWVYPSQPMGDVVLVYEPWATAALAGGPIVGVDESWVYPQLALVPMIVAKAISLPLIPALGASHAYLIAWALLTVGGNAIGFAVLIGRTSAHPRRLAAWFWCIAVLLLGPIAIYRIDAVTVPLAVAAGLWVLQRPAVAAALLAVGAWIKIWPGALLLAALVAARRRWRMLFAAASVTAGVVAVLWLLGAREEIIGFLTAQTGRGVQIEAVAATPFLWLALAGTARIEYSFDILTFQIAADGVDAVSALLTPAMALAVVLVAAIGATKAARGASAVRLLPPLALALVTALIVCNKVGSPQFQTWLLAPVVLWIVLDRARAAVPAFLVLALAGLTCLVYPLSYDALLRAELVPVVLLTARNVVLVVLLATGIRSLLRVPIPSVRPLTRTHEE